MTVTAQRIFLAMAFATFGWAACSAPQNPAAPAPTSTPTPTPMPPVANTPPVIHSVTTSVSRAEVDQPVDVIADVTDAETPIANLQFIWSANVGGFNGSGAHVTWVLPKGAATTPLDVAISLTVTETFSGGTNSVSLSAAPVRIHDSNAEITKMSLRFLIDLFGNSKVSAKECVIDFSDQCPGKNEEEGQIEDNRVNFVILDASANVASITYNRDKTFADIDAPCSFHDRQVATGTVATSPPGSQCLLTAVYQDQRWWLCDSHFKVPDSNAMLSMQEFFKRRGRRPSF